MMFQVLLLILRNLILLLLILIKIFLKKVDVIGKSFKIEKGKFIVVA